MLAEFRVGQISMNRILTKFLRLRLVFVVLVFAASSVATIAQQETPLRSITYRLAMSRPVSHLFEVTVEVELPEGAVPKSVDFQMPKWSPGRYAVFDLSLI
ncbi:MAG TPA: hypothetical protein DCK93_08420, partial [Blastocatellia bacterium]|nr:hypothetical protein [Blastocatellia bacterium]